MAVNILEKKNHNKKDRPALKRIGARRARFSEPDRFLTTEATVTKKEPLVIPLTILANTPLRLPRTG